ncbi:hypothetical protein D3C86_1991310 [compost metagenome]
MACGYILGSADNLQILALSGVHDAHIQLVGVRVLFFRFHIADNNAGKAFIAALHTVDLDAGGGDSICQLSCGHALKRDIIREPGG